VTASGNQLELRTEDIEGQKILKQKVDMVVLAVGLEPADDTEFLSQILQTPLDDNGWYLEANHLINPVESTRCGIHVAGACQGPKDIPDTVAQASAAASRVLQSIMTGKIKQVTRNISPESVEEKINAQTIYMEEQI
jgi:heterodisulfide reductase subunit A